MSPDPHTNHTNDDNGSSRGMGTNLSPSSTPQGEASVARSQPHETPNPEVETAKPGRASQIGEGSYEGTRGYANSVKAYLGTASVDQDAKAAAPHSTSEARELLAAESEAASHSKAPGK